jgi:centrosomal protein CEP104
MRLVFDIGKELFSLKRDLGHTVAKEDFARAIELRDRIKRLEERRDGFDALYETSRYEKMIALKRPSTAEYLRNLELLDA